MEISMLFLYSYTRVQLTLCSNQAVPTLKVIPKCVTPVRLCRFWPRVKVESAQLYREELWNNFSHRLQGWTTDSYFWSLCWGQPQLSLKTRRSSLIGNKVLLVRILFVYDQLYIIMVNCHQIFITLGQVTDGGFYSSSKASVFVVATESHVVRRYPVCPTGCFF